MMKRFFVCILPILALLLVFSMMAGRADEFTQIANNPNIYWVPAPTPPPPGYVAGYPPPYYYNPPPPRVYYGGPRFFFGFRFH